MTGKCRMCGYELDGNGLGVDGVGPMHFKCEIKRLTGLLLESRSLNARLQERVDQLEGHKLPGEFIAVKRVRLSHLEAVETGLIELIRRHGPEGGS